MLAAEVYNVGKQAKVEYNIINKLVSLVSFLEQIIILLNMYCLYLQRRFRSLGISLSLQRIRTGSDGVSSFQARVDKLVGTAELLWQYISELEFSYDLDTGLSVLYMSFYLVLIYSQRKVPLKIHIAFDNSVVFVSKLKSMS